jgi:Centromere protein H (CENP-H)
MQQQLLRGTSQLQLEHRFLSRSLMSRQEQRDYRQSVHLDDDRQGSVSEVQQLPHGAIKARDRQVSRALKLDAVLSDIREQQRETKDETSRLRRENRNLLDAVRAAESEKQRQQSSSDSGAPPTSTEVENRVLVPLLRDAVLGSGIDWFADDRLREMATRKDLP